MPTFRSLSDSRLAENPASISIRVLPHSRMVEFPELPLPNTVSRTMRAVYQSPAVLQSLRVFFREKEANERDHCGRITSTSGAFPLCFFEYIMIWIPTMNAFSRFMDFFFTPEPGAETAELREKWEERAPGWILYCKKCGMEEPFGKYGYRLKAAGTKRNLGRCPRCRKWSWLIIRKKEEEPVSL